MDARFPKCAPKPPAHKRNVLPALTKTQQRPLRRAGDLTPIKRKDPLPPLVWKSAVVNEAPLQKGKTPVLPDITKPQQRALLHDGVLEPIKRKDPLPPLVLKSAALNKAPLQKGKTPVLPDITKPQQRPLIRDGVLEPIKRKDPLPPLVLKSAPVKKAPLQKGRTIVRPDFDTTPQKDPRPAAELLQRMQKEKHRWCDGQRLPAADALSIFRKYLTPFERREIKEYKEVWYLGIAAEKIQQKCTLRHGYDDRNGHYKMVVKDHIAYRYEVLELMGQGSLSRVLKCRDHKTKQLVAMKVIAKNQRFADVAMAEVEILELLHKKDVPGVANVVHMKEHFHFREHVCITFDLMGKNLHEGMKERGFRGLGTSQLKSHAISLVRSLQFLSRTGIIHCDLKPENILVSEDDSEVIKVADFGSSLLEHHDTDPFAQTLNYKSPEAILKRSYSTAIDMWSLGCILAELKTGRILFNVHDPKALVLEMAKLLGVPPLDWLKRTTLRDKLSGPSNSRDKTRESLSMALNTKDQVFVDFIQSCLEYEPEKRMTPDEAMQHPWIQSPCPRAATSPDQSNNLEHMGDSASNRGPSTWP